MTNWSKSLAAIVAVVALVLVTFLAASQGGVTPSGPALLPPDPPVSHAAPSVVTPVRSGLAPRCSNCVVGQIGVGDGPDGLAYNPQDGQILVTDEAGENVSVIDTADSSTVQSFGVGLGAGGIIYDTSSRQFWVANQESNNLSIVDSVGNIVVDSIGDAADQPYAVAYDAANGNVYVTNSGTDNVSVFAGNSRTYVSEVGVGALPLGVTYDPFNGDLYVDNFESANVSVISGSTNKVIATVNVGTEPWGAAVDPQNGEIFVANHGSSNVSVISGSTNLLVGSPIVVGPYPYGVAYSNASGLLYVSTAQSSYPFSTSSVVSVINGTTETVGPLIPVGVDSNAELVIPTSGDLYVTNYASDNVSVIATRPASTGPVISSFTANPSSFTLGGTTDLMVAASGGVGTLSYTYTGLPTGCSTADVASLDCTPTVSGGFAVSVFVNDTAHHSATAGAIFTVSPSSGPTISSFTATPSTVTAGGSVTLAVTASGGTAPLSFAYTDLPSGCATTDAASLTCNPSSSGSYTVRVYVNDSASHSATVTTSLVVNPSSVPIIGSFEAVPSTVTVGNAVALEVDASGGTGSLSYAYTGLPGGCSSSNTATLDCTPSATGSFTVRVFVNDTASHSATSTTPLTVSPSNVPSITSFTVSPTSVTQGSAAVFKVVATGGTGTLSYAYAGLPPGCPSSNTASLSCTSTSVGVFEVRAYVNDSASHSTSATASLTVTSSSGVPLLASVSVSPSTSSVATGGSVSFTSSLTCSGGSCPGGSVYLWSTPSGAGTFSAAASPTTTYTAGSSPGTVEIELSVTLNDVTRTGWANVTVTSSSPSSSSGILGLSGSEGYAVIGAVIVGVVVVALLVTMRMRKKPAALTPAPAASEPPASSTPSPATAAVPPPPPPPPPE